MGEKRRNRTNRDKGHSYRPVRVNMPLEEITHDRPMTHVTPPTPNGGRRLMIKIFEHADGSYPGCYWDNPDRIGVTHMIGLIDMLKLSLPSPFEPSNGDPTPDGGRRIIAKVIEDATGTNVRCAWDNPDHLWASQIRGMLTTMQHILLTTSLVDIRRDRAVAPGDLDRMDKQPALHLPGTEEPISPRVNFWKETDSKRKPMESIERKEVSNENPSR